MTEDPLAACCKTLRLGNLGDLYDQVEFNNRKQYLTGVLELAIEQRRARWAERLIKQAAFPVAKTLDTFEFDPVTLPQGLDRTALTELHFIERRENVLCLGTGKTHLAIALGMKACLQGLKVAFYRAADLTQELLEQHRAGTAGRLMRRIARADLFILDEVGYVPFCRQASQLLFSTVASGYEQQSLIVTSNLEFGRWNEVFGDDRLTAALVDRLVHHAHILAFTGDSYRLRQAMARRTEDAPGEGKPEGSNDTN